MRECTEILFVIIRPHLIRVHEMHTYGKNATAFDFRY